MIKLNFINPLKRDTSGGMKLLRDLRGDLSFREAGEKFDIPHSTIQVYEERGDSGRFASFLRYLLELRRLRKMPKTKFVDALEDALLKEEK